MNLGGRDLGEIWQRGQNVPTTCIFHFSSFSCSRFVAVHAGAGWRNCGGYQQHTGESWIAKQIFMLAPIK
jgi:hypothetical protein